MPWASRSRWLAASAASSDFVIAISVVVIVIDIDIVIVMILNILIAMANELTSANLAMPSQYMLYLLLPLLPTQLPSPNHPSHRWPLQPFAT